MYGYNDVRPIYGNCDIHILICGYIYIYIYNSVYSRGVNTEFLPGESPNVRSYTVHICGAGQPYLRLK